LLTEPYATATKSIFLTEPYVILFYLGRFFDRYHAIKRDCLSCFLWNAELFGLSDFVCKGSLAAICFEIVSPFERNVKRLHGFAAFRVVAVDLHIYGAAHIAVSARDTDLTIAFMATDS